MDTSTNKEGKLPARIAAIALALALAIAGVLYVVPAFADDDTDDGSYSIEITDATAGTYSVYQVFSGNFSEQEEEDGTTTLVMGNAELNSELEDAVISALNSVLDEESQISSTDEDGNELTDAVLANRIADAIAELDDETAQDFANALANLIATSETTISAASTATVETSGDTASLSVTETGYYLVIEEAAEGDAATSAILVSVADDVTAEAKASTPTAEKEVVVNTNGSAITFNDDGTASITYQVTGTVASNIADYAKYIYNFVDTLPEGIKITEDELNSMEWSITVGETDVSSSFSASVASTEDGSQSVVTWACSDLLSIDGVEFDGDEEVVLVYTVVLDSDEVSALFGAEAETTELVNEVEIEFSSDPYGDGSDTSTTPETDDQGDEDNPGSLSSLYKLTVYKVDEDGEALTGAVFELTADGESAGYAATVDDGGTFVYTGLQANVEYTLTETETPDGYKSIDPISFTIAATENDDGTVSVSVSETSDPSDAAEVSFTVTTDEDGTETTSTTSITATVTNTAGTELPFTGGQGIALGVLVGAAIITVSCVAIYRNRREDSEEA